MDENQAKECIDQIRHDPQLSRPEAAVNFAYGVILSHGYTIAAFIDATKLLEPKAEKE